MRSILRRDFLSTVCAGAVVHLLSARVLRARVIDAEPPGDTCAGHARSMPPQPNPHPAPRRGITAAKLPPKADLADVPDAAGVFDLVREIPEVIDGIRCNCSCAGSPGYRSLLSCYELPDLMAKTCDVCKAQARLAHRMHKSGKSLNEIRKGVDARFGG